MTGALHTEDQILVALRRVTRAIDLRSRMLLQDHGLTTPQLLTLLAVARLQPVTATAVAREVHLGQPTVTGILSRLERRGWIQRTRGERDRRSVSIRLTASGNNVLEQAPSLLAPGFRDQFHQMRDWEQTQLLSILQRLAQMMDAGLAGDDEWLERPAPGQASEHANSGISAEHGPPEDLENAASASAGAAADAARPSAHAAGTPADDDRQGSAAASPGANANQRWNG